MKKTLCICFFLLLWGVAEAFLDPLRLIPTAVFAAALICLALIKKPVPGVCAAAACCIGLGVPEPDFLLRGISALLIAFACFTAARVAAAKQKKKNGGRDAVYTAVLASVLISAGVLIHDISFCIRNHADMAILPFVWFGLGVACCFLWLSVFAGKQKNGTARLMLPVFIGGLVGTVFACAGYLMNSTQYDVFLAVFPWCLTLVAVSDTDAVRQAAEGFEKTLCRLLRNGE